MLENDQTHLVLASGKLALQNKIKKKIPSSSNDSNPDHSGEKTAAVPLDQQAWPILLVSLIIKKM